jgi:hypothetical protein
MASSNATMSKARKIASRDNFFDSLHRRIQFGDQKKAEATRGHRRGSAALKSFTGGSWLSRIKLSIPADGVCPWFFLVSYLLDDGTRPVTPLFYPMLNKALALPLLEARADCLWSLGRQRNLTNGEGQGYTAWRVLPAAPLTGIRTENGHRSQKAVFAAITMVISDIYGKCVPFSLEAGPKQWREIYCYHKKVKVVSN